ncbi:MAG: ankyrin repeat domain-containing protein [Acidobacteriota bacterium]|nr:MAG: ankyrin repeat domain-containing protein [Acidobacteriota bacterium]
MYTLPFIRYCVFIGFFASALMAQGQRSGQNDGEVRACFLQRFPQTDLSRQEAPDKGKAERCADTDPALCLVAQGIAEHNFQGIACLVKAGYDFNVESGKYDANLIPITAAAIHDLSIFKLLLTSKIPIDVNVKDKAGRTPLANLVLTASLMGSIVKLKKDITWEVIYQSTALLLEEGVDPNDTIHGPTPLVIGAVLRGSTEYAALFLRFGANPDAQLPDGETALMLADDDPAIIALLLKAGVNIHIQDAKGKSAIFYAIEKCHANKVKALVEVDRSVLESKDKNGVTARELLWSKRSDGSCVIAY